MKISDSSAGSGNLTCVNLRDMVDNQRTYLKGFPGIQSVPDAVLSMNTITYLMNWRDLACITSSFRTPSMHIFRAIDLSSIV